jgi:hypothetical protein
LDADDAPQGVNFARRNTTDGFKLMAGDTFDDILTMARAAPQCSIEDLRSMMERIGYPPPTAGQHSRAT